MRKKIIEQEKSIQLDLIRAHLLIEEYTKAKQLELQLVEGIKLISQYENAIRTYYNIYIVASGAVLVIWARFGFEKIVVEALIPLGMFVFSIFTALFIHRLRRPLASFYVTMPLVERHLGLDLQEKFQRLNKRKLFKRWWPSSQNLMTGIVLLIGFSFLVTFYIVASENRGALTEKIMRTVSSMCGDMESIRNWVSSRLG